MQQKHYTAGLHFSSRPRNTCFLYEVIRNVIKLWIQNCKGGNSDDFLDIVLDLFLK